MIRVIDLAGYAAPMMMLLMTREMSLRVLGMFSHVAGCHLQYRSVPSARVVAAFDALADERTTAVAYADRHSRG